MNLNKHLDFITPTKHPMPIHIIGVGAIGSRIAEQLVRLGFDDINIYDFDRVDEHNITNQIYTTADLGKLKTEALADYLKLINPRLEIKCFGKYDIQRLEGSVFLCVDSIKTRQEIVDQHEYNERILTFYDCRMRLTDAQAYAANWECEIQRKNFRNTMNFTDAEADAETPISVCGTSLSVMPTVVTIVSLTIANFINVLKGNPIKNVILVDPFMFTLDAFTQKF